MEKKHYIIIAVIILIILIGIVYFTVGNESDKPAREPITISENFNFNILENFNELTSDSPSSLFS